MKTPESLALPSAREVELALAGRRGLAAFVNTQGETQRIQVFDNQDRSHSIELPSSVMRLLVDILVELAEGNAVKVVPVHAELTTQEAADLLNVSRPHLVGLLESGRLPFRKTGKHRRVRFTDLMAYRTERAAASEAAMQALAAQAQDLGLGYE